MDTTEFERRLQLYFAKVNAVPLDYKAAEWAAWEALDEAAALLGVSMAVKLGRN